VTLLLAIETHEIEEGYGRLERCLGNEGDLLAGLEKNAGIVGIQGELSKGFKTDQGISVVLIPKPSDELCFVRVAGVLAPHALETHRAHWAVEAEDGIDLDEIGSYIV
jgi:hypothetical protein